jgi:hypothetical protein
MLLVYLWFWYSSGIELILHRWTLFAHFCCWSYVVLLPVIVFYCLLLVELVACVMLVHVPMYVVYCCVVVLVDFSFLDLLIRLKV